MRRVENVTGPVAHHAEGPVWSATWGGLRYVDLLAGDLLTLTAAGEVERMHVGKVAAFHRPRVGGGFVVALERGLGLADHVDGPVRPLAEIWDESLGIRFNDGGCSPAGTLYGGTMAYDAVPAQGTLYRFGPDLTPEVVCDGVTVSNGLGFSPDGTVAYYNDTPTGRVDVFDNQADHLVHRRPFAQLGEGAGQPDGLCVDAEGGVWVACWGGSAVRRYSPEGVLDEVVELPVSQVSACTFGGQELATLFVTTSAENLDPGTEREAGSVYAVDPGVRGLPVLPVGV